MRMFLLGRRPGRSPEPDPLFRFGFPASGKGNSALDGASGHPRGADAEGDGRDAFGARPAAAAGAAGEARDELLERLLGIVAGQLLVRAVDDDAAPAAALV